MLYTATNAELRLGLRSCVALVGTRLSLVEGALARVLTSAHPCRFVGRRVLTSTDECRTAENEYERVLTSVTTSTNWLYSTALVCTSLLLVGTRLQSSTDEYRRVASTSVDEYRVLLAVACTRLRVMTSTYE